MFVFGLSSISMNLLYICSLVVTCCVFGDVNDKGKLPPKDKTASFYLQASKHTNASKTERARDHRRYPRKAVANLPLERHLDYMVDKSLAEECHSITKPFGGFVEFDCDTKATKAIFKQYARASRQWIHNYNALEIESDRMVYQLGLLTIQNLKPSDQGVYICRIEYEPEQFKSVALFTLIVESSEPNIRVQETRPLNLQSHSAPLGYLFPSATRTWSVNGKVFRSKTPASQTNEDEFANANKTFEGVWTCTVSHKQKNTRTWKVARYVVKLMPPPSKSEVVLNSLFTHPITTVMVCLVFAGFLLVIFIACVYRADQAELSAKAEMDTMKERLLSNKEP
ncbi:uncharacterized protein [Argopecten irradians]|uniref:uncharacterized protein n=1 Tax=Argopecten irradians TaxID=31199 RepID=UPI0037106717